MIVAFVFVILCGLLGAVAWEAMAGAVNDKYSAVAMILLSSLSTAMSDVVSRTAMHLTVTASRMHHPCLGCSESSCRRLCWR